MKTYDMHEHFQLWPSLAFYAALFILLPRFVIASLFASRMLEQF